MAGLAPGVEQVVGRHLPVLGLGYPGAVAVEDLGQSLLAGETGRLAALAQFIGQVMRGAGKVKGHCASLCFLLSGVRNACVFTPSRSVTPRFGDILLFTSRRRLATAPGGGVPIAATTHDRGKTMSSDQLPDFTRFDDSALLSMRAGMRAELERLPANSAARAALTRVYDASTTEVTDRARKAWAGDQ